jgi:hypothetical protein
MKMLRVIDMESTMSDILIDRFDSRSFRFRTAVEGRRFPVHPERYEPTSPFLVDVATDDAPFMGSEFADLRLFWLCISNHKGERHDIGEEKMRA